jgi:hypothetical protein
VNHNEKSARRAARKKRVAIWNRRLAWVTLPFFLVSTISTYLVTSKTFPELMATAMVSSMVFILLFFAHTIFGVYLFGFPKLKWQIRVVHIYVGYLLFIFTILSQAIIGVEPYHNIAYGVMWVFLICHVGLSFRFMLKRNYKKNAEPSLRFRGEDKAL